MQDPSYWVRHLRHTVRFADGMTTLLEDASRVFVEVGPGRTLSGLARQQPKKLLASTPTMRHPKEACSDVAFLLGTAGRMWLGGARLGWEKLVSGPRRRVPLPSYPFERERYWIEPGKTLAAARSSGPLGKRPESASWFYAHSWKTEGLVPSPPLPASTKWLLLANDSSLSTALSARLPGQVTLVTAGKHFQRLGPQRYTIRTDDASDYDALVQALAQAGELPSRVVHLLGVTAKPPAWAKLARGSELAAFDRELSDFYSSQLFLVQALAQELEELEWVTVATSLFALAGEQATTPAKALLLGPTRVIPREWPRMRARVVDFAPFARNSFQQERLIDELVLELGAGAQQAVVAYRSGTRWVEQVEPTRIDAAPDRAWLQPKAAVLITGGLGGIGFAVATHLARVARARLVLVGRSQLPARDSWDKLLRAGSASESQRLNIEKVRELEALGAEVVVESADVTDLEAMRRVLARARARFGRLAGVVHSAGTLRDAPIALRRGEQGSEVIATKAKGALVLDELLRSSPPDFFVLFSSVSSLLGLPGQVDYTSGNAFLDAFARARSARCPGRTVSIDWNAWQEVGMAVDLVRAQRAGIHVGSHPLLKTFRRAQRPGRALCNGHLARETVAGVGARRARCRCGDSGHRLRRAGPRRARPQIRGASARDP